MGALYTSGLDGGSCGEGKLVKKVERDSSSSRTGLIVGKTLLNFPADGEGGGEGGFLVSLLSNILDISPSGK